MDSHQDSSVKAAEEGGPALSFKNVCKLYHKGKLALSDLSFDVGAGSVTALLGPNGAGKSTALRILVGLTNATGGRVEVMSSSIEGERGKFQDRIGYVGQFTNLEVTASARQNLELQASLFRLPAAVRRTRVDYLMERFDLGRFADKRAMTLSGGQRRRLDIAMALVHDPSIVILDEPSVNLDVDSDREIWHHLLEARSQKGLTLLFSTHHLDQADRHADQIVFINQGRTVATGTPAALKTMVSGDTITLTCDDADAAAHSCAAVEELADVRSVAVQGHNLVVVVVDGPHLVAKVVGAVQATGHDVRKVTVSSPSLNEVYTLVTGDSFDIVDEAGKPPPRARGFG